MLDWEWYTDINTKVVFLHCLIKANWEDKRWRGVVIKRGQFYTSIENFAKETKISQQSVRTSFSKLKSTNEITIKSTNKGTMITVCKYDDYQSLEKPTNKRLTNKTTNEQQTTNKQLTTTKKYKEEEEVKKEIKSIDFDKFLLFFNETTGKKLRVINNKARTQINARLKDGYTKADLMNTVINCAKDKFHLDNELKYLTPEFISRADKIDMYSAKAEKKETAKIDYQAFYNPK